VNVPDVDPANNFTAIESNSRPSSTRRQLLRVLRIQADSCRSLPAVYSLLNDSRMTDFVRILIGLINLIVFGH